MSYCGKCGASMIEGSRVCLSCVKGTDYGGYPLSNFTAKSFRVLFEVILWLILIGGFVAFVIFAYAAENFLWTISIGIGIFVTFILIGGLVSLLIKLVNNSEEIKKQLKDMQKQP